jgi:hypothetical protein
MKNTQRLYLSRWGLALHHYKILVLTFSLALMLILLSVAVVTTAIALVLPVGWIGALLVVLPLFYVPIMLCLWAIAVLLGLVGSILCLWVPRRTGAKPFIVAALLLESLGLFLFTFGGLSGLALIGSGLEIPAVGELTAFFGDAMVLSFLVGMICMFSGWVLFLLFSRALLLFYFTDSLTAQFTLRRVTRSIVLIVCTPFYVVLSLIIVKVAISLSAPIGPSTLIALIIIFCLLWFRLLLNIVRIMEVLRTRMRHLEEREGSPRVLPRIPLRSLER